MKYLQTLPVVLVLGLVAPVAAQPYQYAQTSTTPCADKIYNIDGFPEYAVRPEQLDQMQQAKLQEIVNTIEASFRSPTPIKTIQVVGHADRALRKPENERPSFEQSISEQRARNMLTMITSRLSNQGFGLTKHARGVGANNRPFPNASNETQMRANRRVEITLSHCDSPHPQPRPRPEPNPGPHPRPEPEPRPFPIDPPFPPRPQPNTCPGITQFDVGGFGPKLWLDECKTRELIAALKGEGSSGIFGDLCSFVGGIDKRGDLVCKGLKLISRADVFLIENADSRNRKGVILQWSWGVLINPGQAVTPQVTPQQ